MLFSCEFSSKITFRRFEQPSKAKLDISKAFDGIKIFSIVDSENANSPMISSCEFSSKITF